MSWIGTGPKVRDLVTPALVLDRGRLEANIARVQNHAAALGATLRPHVKTPKSIEVARRLLARSAKGITISTLAEAEYFASNGITNQLYATALAPAKLGRVARLLVAGVDLCAVVDSQPGALALARAAAGAGIRLPLLIELNLDDYRSGVRPGSWEFEAMLAVFDGSPALEFRGLMAYAGASYHCPDDGCRKALAERHRIGLTTAAAELEKLGRACPVRSFGSTPAFMQADRMDGVTEVRGGVYVFQDLFQAGSGACRLEDISLSVAATVISHQPSLNRLFIDAGGLALSKDRSTAGTPFDIAFGLVADETGRLLDDLWVRAVHQELGEVTTRSGDPLEFARLPVGRVVRILPNHADMTAAAYAEYNVVDGGDHIVDVWERVNGW